VLSGHTRYSHITTIRQNTVNPPLLGMTKILSEDSVGRSFQNIDPDKCRKWQQDNLKYCYDPLLEEDWILDVDATIKQLYGRQEGAEVSYNPTEPGWPSHIIYTYSMAETRLILDCELLPGKQYPSCYSLHGRLNEIAKWLILRDLYQFRSLLETHFQCVTLNLTTLGFSPMSSTNIFVPLD